MSSQWPVRLKRWGRFVVVAAVVSIAFWTIVLMIFEEKFVFFPAVYPEGRYEAEARVLQPEEHWFATENGARLHGWFLRSSDTLGTILLFHGNAGNLSHRGEIIRRLRESGFHVFVFDYQGYGKSEGTPSESGIYKDGLAAVEYVRTVEGVNPRRLFYLGRSLGGAVAVDVATYIPPVAMILESTFSSARDVAATVYPFLPLRFILKTRLDSESKIQSIHVPLLFFHGANDGVIPLRLGRKLFEAANSPKEFVEIPGAGHNDTFLVGGNDYLHRIRSFCLSIPR